MKKEILFISTVFLVLLLLSPVLAITAKIGNLRMVLYPEVGETLQKSIRVINDNEVPVTITLSATGDLEKQVNILDNNFVLQPREEKQARFTIKTNEEGTFETRINVGFKPETGNAAGLVATVTVVAKGDSTGSNDETSTDLEETDSGFSFNPSPSKEVPASGLSFSPVYFFALSPVVLIIVLVILLVYFKKKGKTKQSKRMTKRRE